MVHCFQLSMIGSGTSHLLTWPALAFEAGSFCPRVLACAGIERKAATVAAAEAAASP